jgi:hypothetical protein
MPEIALVMLAVAMVIAVSNWRYGFALCVLVALVQDPLRKMTPDQPVYFVAFVGATFGCAWLGALMDKVPLLPKKIYGWQKHVGLSFNLFVVLAVIQAARSLILYDNPMIAGIGMLSYFAPIPAIVLAYQFAVRRGMRGVTRWMKFYVVLASLALASVYLEYVGAGWPVLGEVGHGVFISGAGALYKGNSGTFRAAEIAAWHAATTACFCFMLLWGRRLFLPRVLLAAALVVFFLGLGVLTGRRKMIIEIAIFLSTYVALVVWFRHRAGKLAILFAIFGVVAYLGAVGMMAPDPGEYDHRSAEFNRFTDSAFDKYSYRASTVFADVPKRIDELGLRPVGWAVDQFGWFGAGLGVGSQGTAHFGVNATGAAEGGLGKLTVELGVPGLALVGWMGIQFGLYVWGFLGPLARTSPKHANLAYGFIAFILANVAAFSVATQAYGDIFILLSLGWAVGFLLALPVLARTQKERVDRARLEVEGSANPAGEALEGGYAAWYRQNFENDRVPPPR